MIYSNLSYMKSHLDGQILASEASRLQIGVANCNQRGGGAAQSNVSPLSWATRSRCFIGSIGSAAVAQAEVEEMHHY